MTRGGSFGILVGMLTDRAGMGGIALLGAGGRGDCGLVIVTECFHEAVTVAVGAFLAVVQRIALRAGGGDGLFRHFVFAFGVGRRSCRRGGCSRIHGGGGDGRILDGCFRCGYGCRYRLVTRGKEQGDEQ